MMNRVISCDILSVEEAIRYSKNISPMATTWTIKSGNDLLWWGHGIITDGRAIRPCLRMEECDLPTGTSVNWFGLTWTNIGDGIFLCKYAIGYLTENWDYIKLKTWLTDWYFGWNK